jgi:hypothetical protein
MKNACPKEYGVKYSGVGFMVFYEVCLPYPIFCFTQELFVKLMTMVCRKCYNIENITKILRQLEKNEGNFILTWNSGLMIIDHLNRLATDNFTAIQSPIRVLEHGED